MKKADFTVKRIAGFKCESGKQQSLYWDGKAPGLGVRVTPADSKSFVFETRLHGRTIRITIGDVRTWTIGKAQAEATRLKSLADRGIDPRQEKTEQRAKAEAAETEAKRQSLTLGDVWPIYIEARRSKWSEGHYQDHIRVAGSGGTPKKRGPGVTAPGPLSILMPVLLAELNADRLAEWLQTESITRPTSAALAFRLLRAFMGWAADTPAYRNTIPADAFTSRAVRDALPKSKTKEGDSLQREQLPAWFVAVRSIPNPIISAYLQALLLTGARRREMGSLRWDDVDFKWRSMTIRDKVEGTRVIPLPPYLASLFLDLKRRNDTPPNISKLREMENGGSKWTPSPWVFSSSASADGKLTEPRIAHTNAVAAAGLPHVSLHGLRRSFGTLCEWVEMPSGISAQIMGHKPSALAEKHYRRRPLDLLRKWHDAIEIWMLKQAGISFSVEKPKLSVVG